MTIKFLGENGKQTFDAGDSITLKGVFKEQSTFEDEEPSLFDPQVTSIEITDFDDNVVEEGEFTKHDVGEYFFDWNTNGLNPSDYLVKAVIEKDGAKEVEKEWIRLNNGN